MPLDIKIDCGRTTGGTVSGWLQDVYFGSGSSYSPWSATPDTSGVTSPAPDAVYNVIRYSGGGFYYQITGGVTQGETYTVRLHYTSTAGSETQSQHIDVDNVRKATSFSAYTAAGSTHNKVVILEYTVVAAYTTGLVIDFLTSSGNAYIVGIEVIEDVPPPDPLVITTTSVPNGMVDTAYSTNLAATGGVEPYVWTVASGSLPPGLSLSTAGVISGTPTTAGVYPFTVLLTDDDAVTDTQALTITIAAFSYDVLQITPGLRLESITWGGPVLRASFGNGYGAQALVGNASGLHRWSLHSGGIWWDGTDSMTIGGVSRFEYYWDFFKDHTTGDTDIFTVEWRNRNYHASFADVEMSVEKFKNELIYQGGVEIVQRRVVGFVYEADGSLVGPSIPSELTATALSSTEIMLEWEGDEVLMMKRKPKTKTKKKRSAPKKKTTKRKK